MIGKHIHEFTNFEVFIVIAVIIFLCAAFLFRHTILYEVFLAGQQVDNSTCFKDVLVTSKITAFF